MHYTVSYYIHLKLVLTWPLLKRKKKSLPDELQSFKLLFLVSINMNLGTLRYGSVSWKLFGCSLVHYLHAFLKKIEMVEKGQDIKFRFFFFMTCNSVFSCGGPGKGVFHCSVVLDWSCKYSYQANDSKLAFLSATNTEKHNIQSYTSTSSIFLIPLSILLGGKKESNQMCKQNKGNNNSKRLLQNIHRFLKTLNCTCKEWYPKFPP